MTVFPKLWTLSLLTMLVVRSETGTERVVSAHTVSGTLCFLLHSVLLSQYSFEMMTFDIY